MIIHGGGGTGVQFSLDHPVPHKSTNQIHTVEPSFENSERICSPWKGKCIIELCVRVSAECDFDLSRLVSYTKFVWPDSEKLEL